MLALKPCQHATHLLNTEYDGQAPVAARVADLLQPGQIMAQHLGVEEQQSRQGLAVSRWRHRAVIGQVRQKGFHLRPAHLGRMPQPMKADEGLHPVDVGLLGAQAVMHQAQPFAQLVKYPYGPQWWQVDGGPRSQIFARDLIGRQGWHHGRSLAAANPRRGLVSTCRFCRKFNAV